MDYLLYSYLPWLRKRPHLTFCACWTQVSDRCPLGNLLAHLSRRLTRWAYSIIQWSAVSRHPSPFSVVHTFELGISLRPVGQSWSILCVASLEWGKGCLRFLCRLDQNSGFHGSRKRQWGKQFPHLFFMLFLIRSFSNLQVKRTGIKSRTSSNFSQIGPLPTELGATEHFKNFLSYNWKMVSPS